MALKCYCPCCVKRREARKAKKLTPEEIQKNTERDARFRASLAKSMKESQSVFDEAERSEKNIDRSIIVR